MIKKDIDSALNMLSKNYNNKNTITRASFNSNEYISEYMKHFNLENEPCLTVLGSGEQAFYSILEGASKVDTFDTNRLCFYLFDLKKTACLTLDREEFIKFFPVDDKSTKCFSYKTYLKLRNYLNSDTKEFFDKLYEKSNFINEYNNLRADTFAARVPNKEYYSEENYTKLQKKLETTPISFTNANLFELPESIKNNKEEYNAILLSNIFDFSTLTSKQYLEFLKKDIMPTLKENGTVLAYYLFNKCSVYFKKSSTTEEIYDEKNKHQANIRLLRKRK